MKILKDIKQDFDECIEVYSRNFTVKEILCIPVQLLIMLTAVPVALCIKLFRRDDD